MAWVKKNIDDTTFGSIIRVQNGKYLFLGDRFICLYYFSFPEQNLNEIIEKNNNEVEVWDCPELMKATFPRDDYDSGDTCALAILDKLSDT